MKDPTGKLLEELGALERAYSRGHQGVWSARRRTELIDTCLIEMFRGAGAPEGVALAAIGGYGRRLQLPASDIDILILHDGSNSEEVATLVHDLLYPLWDAGFSVGQAVRTQDEAIALAAGRFDAATAMLDIRYLAGDSSAVARTAAAVLALLREDPRGFAIRSLESAAERHDRYGSTAHLLEPDLKEGAGGLRDIHSLGWLEAVLGAPLEEAGLLRAREREALVAAEEFLVRVRSALQLETGKRSDRLVSDVQPVIARQMGFTDEPRLSDVDGLMRSLFEHARQVVYSSEAAHARYLNGADTSEVAARTAEEVLRAFAAVAATKERLAPSLLDAAEEVEVPADPSWTPEMREDFLSILRGGEPGRKALEGLDRAGLLARLLPEWSDIRCRPQRDPYHRFTVDVHLIEALAGMGRMLSGEEVPDPIAAEAVRHVLDPDGALLGALLHDIGKNGTGGHVQVGAKVAASALARMGIVEPTRSLAEFMVQNHLLLPDTATRRDISDDDLVLDVAAAIGTPERLAALYLLAIADAAATGPAAWTPWRQALVRELVAKVQRTFERGDMGEEVAGRLTERIDRLRDLLEYEPSDAVDRFVLRMPRGYFLSVEPAQAAAHFTTISPQLGTSEVRTTASAGLRPGTYELLVVASDRPGLLSFIAGALSLAGLSILTAQVFTTEDGAAVDLFEVEGAFEPEIGEERWREFRSTLRRAIEGRVSLDHRVEEKRSHYPSPKRKVPVTVTIDNEASDFFTVIEIGAADRIGLLYDITRALADLELDVHLAKIATYTDRVIDAFYVRDALGRKIDDAASMESIDAAIGARLAD